MQEALRQGCRRSARLFAQRAASTANHHHQHGVVAAAAATAGAAGGSDENASAAAAKRRRRRATAQQQQQKPLGRELTNQLRVPQDTAASAGGPSSPPAKRPRAKAAAAAAAPPTADDGVPPPGDKQAAAAGDGSSRAASSSKSGSSKGGRAAAAAGPTRAAEQRLWDRGFKAVAGVDEAGRGPLAGPVVAAAAVLPPGLQLPGLHDSKQMSEADREALFEQLTSHPDVAYAVAVVDHTIIDDINILQAAMLAMQRAVEGLATKGTPADHLLIDGNRAPPGLSHMPLQTIVKGDASSTCIAAASVLAKVTRDRLMLELDAAHPQYGFTQHKGYGVPAHKAAIRQHGPCAVHRRSFEPIKSMVGFAGYARKLDLSSGGGGSGSAAVAPSAAAGQQSAGGGSGGDDQGGGSSQ